MIWKAIDEGLEGLVLKVSLFCWFVSSGETSAHVPVLPFNFFRNVAVFFFHSLALGNGLAFLQDTKSVYEPGKRHWLKVKKDYLEEGRMADTADLIVLGAYFGTGCKGSSINGSSNNLDLHLSKSV